MNLKTLIVSLTATLSTICALSAGSEENVAKVDLAKSVASSYLKHVAERNFAKSFSLLYSNNRVIWATGLAKGDLSDFIDTDQLPETRVDPLLRQSEYEDENPIISTYDKIMKVASKTDSMLIDYDAVSALSKQTFKEDQGWFGSDLVVLEYQSEGGFVKTEIYLQQEYGEAYFRIFRIIQRRGNEVTGNFPGNYEIDN